MRKIQLDVDRLEVESFPTTRDGAEPKGTVQARSLTLPNDSYCDACDTYSGPVNCIC